MDKIANMMSGPEWLVFLCFFAFNGIMFADKQFKVKIPVLTQVLMYLVNPFALVVSFSMWAEVIQGRVRWPKRRETKRAMWKEWAKGSKGKYGGKPTAEPKTIDERPEDLF